MSLFAPKTFASIIAPLHDIHNQLQDLHEKHTNAINENNLAIADIQVDTHAREIEQAQIAKVKDNVKTFLAI